MIKAKFYQSIKASLFKGKLTQAQVSNIELLISEYREYAGLDYRHLAYILATVYHETAGTMEPIREYGLGKGKDYGGFLKYGSGPGKRAKYTFPAQVYYGRGHTQNTWFENYDALTKANNKGWNFLENPDLLLQPEPSAWATLYAMVKGLYTGKRLTSYINDLVTDFGGARYIINGQDKADLIAGYAIRIYNALIIIE